MYDFLKLFITRQFKSTNLLVKYTTMFIYFHLSYETHNAAVIKSLKLIIKQKINGIISNKIINISNMELK